MNFTDARSHAELKFSKEARKSREETMSKSSQGAETQAMRDKSVRLRALRLARDEAEAERMKAEGPTPKNAKRRPPR